MVLVWFGGILVTRYRRNVRDFGVLTKYCILGSLCSGCGRCSGGGVGEHWVESVIGEEKGMIGEEMGEDE